MKLNDRDKEIIRLQRNIENGIISAQNFRLNRDLKGKTITAIQFRGSDLLLTFDNFSQVILSAVEWCDKPTLDFSLTTDITKV